MDPDATLHDLLDAIIEGDIVQARDLTVALIRWRERGGFAPQDPRLSA